MKAAAAILLSLLILGLAVSAFRPSPPLSNLQSAICTQGVQTFVITRTGTHYHRPGCRYLWHSSLLIPFDPSHPGKLTACLRCAS